MEEVGHGTGQHVTVHVTGDVMVPADTPLKQGDQVFLGDER